ncbi:MAG: hypothetical protein O7F71_09515 [Gammaproteobacteria bacterium]|nr:hypothetical protein [Gammaproteobacteria bacterium]
MNPILLKTIAVLALIAIGACTRAETTVAIKTIDAAEKAYFQFDLTEATRLFAQAHEDQKARPETRAAAGRQLARIVSFIHQDHDRARDLIKSVESIGVDRTLAAVQLAQIEREQGNYEAAVVAADRAAAYAETDSERYDAYIEFSHAVLAAALANIFEGKRRDVDQQRLELAFTRIDSVLKVQRGRMTPSMVAFDLAIILGRGAKALDAWRSYFHVHPGTPTTSVLAQPAEVLQRILPNWHNQPLDDGTREALILALAESRMYETAALVALIDFEYSVNARPRIGEIVAYHRYLTNIGKTTRAFYRASALDVGDEGAFKSDLVQHAKNLWPELHWPEDAPRFSEERFEEEIDIRFGAEATFKRINGYFGLHMGHRVADENYQVEQYGKREALRFVSLDFMVSNGYTSWFWDGRANVGGWAANPIIIQIRSAYADQGVDAWKSISDSKLLAKTLRDIDEYAASDIELARQHPYAYLPGLAKRMEHNSHLRLLDELRARGLTREEIQLAFIAEIERTDLESSIIAHEGRHAIDSRDTFNFMRASAEKEFRAKLSEVAFSSAPRLAIGSILAHNIGDGSAHGDANQRIMKGLVEWMKKHGDHIEGLDSSLPLLPQLDRLSAEQLREAFRSMDPLAS